MITSASNAVVPGRILLVDDDDTILVSYARLLEQLGYLVECVATASAALARIGVESFDCVITDVNMARMTGTQFLRAIRERHLELPVILMTGLPETAFSTEAVESAAFRYLRKPVRLATLKNAVREAIHSCAVTGSLRASLPLPAICQRLVVATLKDAEWDFAAVWLPANANQMRCCQTWTRAAERSSGDSAPAKVHQEIAPGMGLPGRVWASGSPEWIAELTTQSESVTRGVSGPRGMNSAFAVPIAADGEVFAVLEFYTHAHRPPDLPLLELFLRSGVQIATQMLRERANERARVAETAERTTSSTLNAIVECAPALIVALDRDGAIQFVNRDLAEVPPSQMIGREWLQYLSPETHQAQVEHLARVLTSGQPETYETTVTGAQGGTRWFSNHLGPLRNEDAVVGAVLVSQEVTELKRTQAEVNEAQQLAAMGAMAAGVAHEVNTPVQFVNDSVIFLRDAAADLFALMEDLQQVHRLAANTEDDELKRALSVATEREEAIDLAYLKENVPAAFRRCLDGLERIATIVRSMKEFSHPSQRQMAAADLNRAIQSTLAIARGEYKYVADLVVELGEIPPIICYVNDINQVVLNLLVNAAHAIGDVVRGTDRKGLIKVQTRQEDDHVLIAISDTGGGIPPNIAERIFEPFFTTKAVGKGTGQGLALARRIVRDKHGGDLTFASQLGQGTTFSIRLPISGKPSTS